MYAVISTGGKHYKVQENDVLNIERISKNPGEKLVFETVLAVGEGENLKLGAPFVSGSVVEAEIVEHLRGVKVIAFKIKRRKGYRRKKGHRQELTKVKISSIKG